MRASHVRRAGALAAAALAVPFLAACGAVQSFEVGECLDLSELGPTVTEVPSLDCDEPHDGEVYHLHEFADGDFPGATQISAELEEACVNAFEPYTGSDYATSIYFPQLIMPTDDSWDRADDRTGICILHTPGETRTDSGRDSGR